MYTTLAHLKASEACVPGYGRMISFFGTSAELKDQQIPLYVVALVGGADDASWALCNAFTFEKETFDAFYRRNLVSALRCSMSANCYGSRLNDNNSDWRKKPHLKELVNEALRAETFEAAETFIQKLKMMRESHWIFENIADHEMFRNPYHFVGFCIDNVDGTYKASSNWALSSERVGGKVHQIHAPARSSNSSDDFGDDEDDDDDHRPRRAVPARVRNARAQTEVEHYWFKSTSKTATKGQNVARLFVDNPYSFLGELKFKMPKGVKIEKKDGVTTMVSTMTDEKSMFSLLRTLTEKSEAPDLDTTN